MKYLLYQDVILHQTMSANDKIKQMQTPYHINRTDRWSIHVPIGTSKDTNQNVDATQDDGQWISVPHNYVETGHRQDFNDYDLIQDEYLKSVTVTDNSERMYPPDRQNIQKIDRPDTAVRHTHTKGCTDRKNG